MSCPACPDLAVLADRAAGNGDSYAGASEDELIGVLCAWARLKAHAAARELAVIAELARRNPELGCRVGAGDPPVCTSSPGPAGLRAGRVPGRGRWLLTVAVAPGTRLRGTLEALRDGIITWARPSSSSTPPRLLDPARPAPPRPRSWTGPGG